MNETSTITTESQVFLPQVLRFGIPSLDELFGSEVLQSRWPNLPNGGKWTPDPTPIEQLAANAQQQQEAGITGVRGLRLRDDDRRQNLPLSLCIAGTDGTGKSILALHLASRYAADCMRWSAASIELRKPDTNTVETDAPAIPKIIYISTDLTASRARSVWKSFRLCEPNQRVAPFGHQNRQATDCDIEDLKKLEIDLVAFDAGTLEQESDEKESGKKLGDFLTAQNFDVALMKVAFIDLAESTAGDDWGLVNRLIGSLPRIKDGIQPRHLVVIDAVEGLEVMSGDRDLFGELRTRRSRVAQVIRAARGKCHVCFVLEDSGEEERLPEEYVTDAVLRLRASTVDNYVRRTAEVVKARGQQCVRGQHVYVIRDGKGALRGGLSKERGYYAPDDFHPDDPFNPSEDINKVRSRIDFQGYVQVFRSLHSFSRDVMNATPEPVSGAGQGPVLKFHTPKFGALMKKEVEGDGRGLSCGVVTALLGDDATHKGRIGRAFLAGAFEPWDIYPEQAVVLITSNTISKETLIGKLPWHWNHHHDYGKDMASRLAEDDFKKCQKAAWSTVGGEPQKNDTAMPSLVDFLPELTKQQQGLVVCRQLEAHNMNSAALFMIIRRCVESAICKLAEADERNLIVGEKLVEDYTAKPLGPWSEDLRKILRDRPKSRPDLSPSRPKVADRLEWLFGKYKARTLRRDWLPDALRPNSREWHERKWQAPRVRLVIDDWTVIQEMYPEVARDPVFLPFLIRYLERVGVSTLFIASQSGHSDGVAISERDRELRSLVRHHIYTWRVHFYGQEKVAISAIPPMEDYLDSVVREIGPVPGEMCRKNVKVVKLACEANSEVKTNPQSGPEKNNERLWIDPHFELYLGLDKAEPKPVPLSVQLFSQAPGFREYVSHKNRLMASLFHPPHNQSEIIITQDPDRYAALRDFALYAGEIHRDDTTILQVDEYWPAEPLDGGKIGTESSLREDGYLQKRTFRSSASAEDKVRHNDPYGTYIPTDPMRASRPGETWRKKDFFNVPDIAIFGDRTDDIGSADGESPDQARGAKLAGWDAEAAANPEFVPFFWDFGFLLLREEEWTALREWHKSKKSASAESGVDVVNCILEPLSPFSASRKIVVWKDFLQLARQASHLASDKQGQRVPALDVDMQGPQSFACLVLEIWASEIRLMLGTEAKKSKLCSQLNKHRSPYSKAKAEKDDVVSKSGVGKDSLRDLLAASSNPDGETTERHALFRTFLMLGAVLDPADFLDEWGQFKHRKVNNAAVAVRHWYSTGSVVWRQTEPTGIVKPYRLPGNYSTRGDWFLWVSPESRSTRLGHHAIDLFCRRRGNLSRMQLGLGLPVRRLDTPPDKHAGESSAPDRLTADIFKTAMATYDDRGKRRTMSYGEVKSLGCIEGDTDFQWLWRSHIKAYARHSNTFEKWLARVFDHWRSWLELDGERAQQGLELCTEYQPIHAKLPKAWCAFIEECNALEMELPASDTPRNPQ